MKGFIKLIIVIAVLGGIWFAWEQWKGNEAIQVDYQTEPLEKGDLMITIEATGVTEPDELVDVGAQVSGIIMEFGKDMNGFRSRLESSRVRVNAEKVVPRESVAEVISQLKALGFAAAVEEL